MRLCAHLLLYAVGCKSGFSYGSVRLANLSSQNPAKINSLNCDQHKLVRADVDPPFLMCVWVI